MTLNRTFKVITVVGARPNFMKAAPILSAIREHNQTGRGPAIQNLLLHTGQHYDSAMSDRFFADLGIPDPDVHLCVGSGIHGKQTAEILQRFEEVLLREWPDLVIVVGDVNSTLACALATAKLAVPGWKARPLIAHVESGLRSRDREMPEEINRILTDHLADILFVTEKSGLENLRLEGIPEEKVFLVGNTMIDSLLTFQDRADESPILGTLGLGTREVGNTGKRSEDYALLTLHRPSNVDSREALQNILKGISATGREMQIVFPVHPRTRKRIEEFGLDGELGIASGNGHKGVRMIEPLGYIEFMCLMKNARLVLTDSGGVQEETTCLGVPCITIRENTERPATVEQGTNIIAGTSVEGIQKAIARQLTSNWQHSIPEKWDGKAAQRIVPILLAHLEGRVADKVTELG